MPGAMKTAYSPVLTWLGIAFVAALVVLVLLGFAACSGSSGGSESAGEGEVAVRPTLTVTPAITPTATSTAVPTPTLSPTLAPGPAPAAVDAPVADPVGLVDLEVGPASTPRPAPPPQSASIPPPPPPAPEPMPEPPPVPTPAPDLGAACEDRALTVGDRIYDHYRSSGYPATTYEGLSAEAALVMFDVCMADGTLADFCRGVEAWRYFFDQEAGAAQFRATCLSGYFTG